MLAEEGKVDTITLTCCQGEGNGAEGGKVSMGKMLSSSNIEISSHNDNQDNEVILVGQISLD